VCHHELVSRRLTRFRFANHASSLEATTPPTLPVTISDELVEFYAFVFCQRGFRRLDMSFEQFLVVAAVVKPLDSPMGLEGAGGWGKVLR